MSAQPNDRISPAAQSRRAAGEATRLTASRRPSPESARFALRLKVYLTRGRLDREIAGGSAAEGSEELALRSRQLIDPRNQCKIAGRLRRIVEYADKRSSGPAMSAVMIDASSVRRGRRALGELAEQLERAGRADPRGVVLAQELLSDGSSPLFNRHADRTVARAARDIRDALDGRPLAATRAA